MNDAEYEFVSKETIDVRTYPVNSEAVRLIPHEVAARLNVLALSVDGDTITVASGRDLSVYDVDYLEAATGKRLKIYKGCSEHIVALLGEMYYRYDVDDVYDAGEPTAIGIVNMVIGHAIEVDASDIHVEPDRGQLRIRFRLDGQLCDMHSVKGPLIPTVLTRIKLMAGIDISEKRLPQDGRIEVTEGGHSFDIRVSTLPTVHGEKIVLRLLNRKNMLMTRLELGFTDGDMKAFESILSCHNGVILVTGPTGSGKTTTLYSVISELNSPDKNIVTIEDPVEYKLDGINQMQVNTKAGMVFSKGLRAILRQDPDIILVGEIRDEETADIAIRAAITGHLVFSTLHTNDAPSAMVRLMDMGVKPYLMAAAIRGVVAQRLVRKICSNCALEYMPDDRERNVLGIDETVHLYRGAGCSHCHHTGYDGRIAVHEVMKIDADMRELIYTGCTYDSMKLTACKNGMKTLMENCRKLLFAGVTTFDEYMKIMNTID